MNETLKDIITTIHDTEKTIEETTYQNAAEAIRPLALLIKTRKKIKEFYKAALPEEKEEILNELDRRSKDMIARLNKIKNDVGMSKYE